MRYHGSSILFINPEDQILLFLRDDKPSIPYPNYWDILGGHVEEGESHEKAIVREMKEELDKDGVDLDIRSLPEPFQLFTVTEFPDRTEYTYWQRVDSHISQLKLKEGQRLGWFTREEALDTELAFGFNTTVEDFYQKALFARE